MGACWPARGTQAQPVWDQPGIAAWPHGIYWCFRTDQYLYYWPRNDLWLTERGIRELVLDSTKWYHRVGAYQRLVVSQN